MNNNQINDDNILYHYSNKPLEVILSREQQAKRNIIKLTQDQKDAEIQKMKFRSDKYPKFKEISFTIDKLPIDIILSAKFNENHLYNKGNILYCHHINIESLNQTDWLISESPLDNFITKYFWNNNNVYKRIFFKIRSILRTILGYRGRDNQKLLKIVKKYKGKYRFYFTRWINSKNFVNENHMYAATVPHAQLYPINGEIQIIKVEKIILN